MNRFLEEDGQGMVEYALIIALIAVACIAVFALLGQNIHDKAKNTATDLAGDPKELAKKEAGTTGGAGGAGAAGGETHQ